MSRLAIVSTHPIQYYAPVFKELSRRHPETKIYYTWGEDSIRKYDPDFKRTIEWDIPLLEGYEYQFLKNNSLKPGTSHFRGIVNPDAIKEIDKFNPDVLLVYGWSWHSHLKIIRHYAKRKLVWFRGDSTLLDSPNGFKKNLRKILLSWIYRHVDKAIYVGSENKKYFQQFGLKEKQLVFAPHSIDNSRFAADRVEESAALKKKLGIDANSKVILFAGKLESKKDPITLLKAFEKVTGENLALLFVGNGELETGLKVMASHSLKRDKISFVDFQNQSMMPVLYQCCDIFCLPSIGPGETWGLAVNEAMASGKAVVVSDKVGCASDLVKDGANGFVFKNKNPDDLAEKLQKLIDNPASLQEFGLASKRIIENWSFEKQVDFILKELNSIACQSQ